MKILVLMRLMPGMGDELELIADGTDIDRDAIGMVINEFDDQALEEAILLKEAFGAEVSVLGPDVEGMEQALRVAAARGADHVALAETGDVGPYDARTLALALAPAVEALAPDLVLTGIQTSYDMFGQLGPYLAEALGWPQVSVVSGVDLADGRARVTQEYSRGRGAVFDVELPAVVGVQSAKSPPRYVSISLMRRAMGVVPDRLSAGTASPTLAPTLLSLSRPERRGAGTMLSGDSDEIAAAIHGLLAEHGFLEA